MLTTFTVNVDYDIAPNSWDDQDSIVTLREAVERADILDDPDTILFDSLLNGGIITLGKDANDNNLNLGSQGQLSITESVTIKGEDLSGNPLDITIDASGNDADVNVDDGGGSRVFNVVLGYEDNPAVSLKNLILTGGDITGFGGAIYFSGDWRGSSESGRLILEHSAGCHWLASALLDAEPTRSFYRLYTTLVS